MTAAYIPAEVERLIAEARPGTFDVNELTSWSIDCLEHFPITAPAATRILQRLARMADQLEAARAEVERLGKLVAATRKVGESSVGGMQERFDVVRDALQSCTIERDAARAEADQLRAAHERDLAQWRQRAAEQAAAAAEVADQLRARVAADEQRIDALVQEVRLAQYERDRARGRAAKLEAQVADRSR